MDKPVFMKCGHTANAEKVLSNGTRIPCCVICAGINSGADIIDDNPPDITKRMAICPDCRKEVPSDFGLPFFEYKPNWDKDTYYCGCRGWD